MPQMRLRKPVFTNSACRPFTKIKERIQKFKETGDIFIKSNDILKIYLEEQLLMKYYVRKHLIFLKNPKYDSHQRCFTQWFRNALINLLLKAKLFRTNN